MILRTFKQIYGRGAESAPLVTNMVKEASLLPNIAVLFGNEVGAILAKPLLWAAFDVEWSQRLWPPEIKHRIISAFIRLDRGVVVGNPVKSVEIIAMEGRNDAVLLVDKWANAIYNLTVSYLPSGYCLPHQLTASFRWLK